MFKTALSALIVATVSALSLIALSSAKAQEPGKFGPLGPSGKRGPSMIRGQAPESGGIQWFATWEAGVREAQRSGRPIMLVAATPHAAGVSGCW